MKINSRKLTIGIFIVACLIQIAFIILRIASYENILKNGQTILLEAAPIDPYDAFRGRYVTLRFKENEAKISMDENMKEKYIYVSFKNNEKKFAAIDKITSERPKNNLYVKVKNNFNFYNMEKTQTMYIEYPFNRLYMNEKLAPKAEEIYRKYVSRDGSTQHKVYAKVKLLNGEGVIEGLYIDDKPIEEYIK